MAIKIKKIFLLSFFVAAGAIAGGSNNGKTYTNFGTDLVTPIFPKNGVIKIFKNRSDLQPIKTLTEERVAQLSGDWKSCISKQVDGWSYCTVGDIPGWVKRSEFLSGAEFSPVESWPFRYWLYIASSGVGGEETYTLRKVVQKNPYLVAPHEYDNIFFYVKFDSTGRAISPKTNGPTGDRVFMVGNAVYLAPSDPVRRSGATWLFLSYYNKELTALCPGRSTKSCMSAVNLSPIWPGIKAMYADPPEKFSHKKNDEAWFGNGEIAFAKHTDPVTPLMYHVPDDVHMRVDVDEITDEQRNKNRLTLFCIADCKTN